MEEFIDTLTGGAIWGIGFGLALGVAGVATRGLRPAVKGAMRGVISVGDWVGTTVEQGRESLEDLYEEAKCERDTEASAG